MSLFQRPIHPPAILSDQAVERYLAAVRSEISVDPLFRRRLRGRVVNRFVDQHQGVVPLPRRRMGAVGRAVLYASFALSVSVSSAMAASQGAVPGDALYALKLQIEHLRLAALPEQLHDDLAAYSLGERIHELGVLAERGEWERVAVQAAAVEGEYRHFVEATRADGPSDRHLVVLEGLLERLPDRAQLAIDDVLDRVQAASDGIGQGRGQAGGESSGSDAGSSSNGGAAGGSATNEPRTSEPASDPTPKPSREARPAPTPRASRTPRPFVDQTVPASPEAENADD